MIGNEEDFTACSASKSKAPTSISRTSRPMSFKKMIQTAVAAFPNFKVAATTLRGATTATLNDWSALLARYQGELYQSMKRENLEIYDRVGGGDGFRPRAWPTASSRAKGRKRRSTAVARRIGDDHAG